MAIRKSRQIWAAGRGYPKPLRIGDDDDLVVDNFKYAIRSIATTVDVLYSTLSTGVWTDTKSEAPHTRYHVNRKMSAMLKSVLVDRVAQAGGEYRTG
jgi:hypothetical protein